MRLRISIVLGMAVLATGAGIAAAAGWRSPAPDSAPTSVAFTQMHPVMILSQQAYGFGPLTVTPDGGSLLFSRVDNASALWRHRLPGNRFNAHLLASYGPAVRVQVLNTATGAVKTLMLNAGRPAVQPLPLPSSWVNQVTAGVSGRWDEKR